MAAATITLPTINFNTQSTLPLRLGTSISKSGESKRFTGVRYNHKPRLNGTRDVKCSITTHKSREDNREELSLKDGDKEYAYLGRSLTDGDRYVLLAKGKGKDMEIVLEKLEGCHVFNLSRTSDEKSVSTLASQYPQLPEDDESGQDLFGDTDGAEDEAPNAENPFDYRNHLKLDANKAKNDSIGASRSGANTPLVQDRPASTTPHSRPSKRSEGPLVSQKKRKAQTSTKANPKRVKAGTEPPTAVNTTAPKREGIPKLRMDRKASLQISTNDDSGELIIENETPVREKPRSAMALALTGQLVQGPISLHSAASSPASRIASPMPPRPEHIEEGEEFEIGENSSPEMQRKRTGESVEHDEDGDADVEDLELPSPAQVHRPPPGRTEHAVEKVGGDDEDDLDKQLALAMAEEDEADAPPPAAPAESDEESEEE